MGVSIILNMGMIARVRDWLGYGPQQTFSGVQDTRYYSLAMALDSGLLDGSGTTREAALGVPAVLKGRNMICNIATLPLVLLDTKRKPVREALFEQTDPQVPNVVTLAMTVEDLLMDGIGWWEKLTYTPFGFPKSARHVDSRRVTVTPPEGYNNPLPSGFDPASTIYVDGQPRSAFNFIRFDSPNPPLLVAAKRAIARAVLLEDTAAMYADNPRPGDYFTPAENTTGLTEKKVRETLTSWGQARKRRSTAYVPETLTYNTVQSPNPQELQLVGLMQRAALDIANTIGVDPEDLGISTTSRTYQNDVSRNQNKVNEVLSGYMRAITDRLSMPDVTRDGYRATIVLDDYLRADPQTRWEIHKMALEMGATDIAEIRAEEDWSVRTDLTPPEPAPVPVPPVVDVSRETSTELVPVAASKSAGLQTFDGPGKHVTFRLDDGATFAVDAKARTITGTILVYDEIADNGEGEFLFRQGSLSWNRQAVSRVKLLRDHSYGALLGAATMVRDEGPRVSATFKVARGPLGDQALSEAEDGALDGLSVGVDITDYDTLPSGVFAVNAAAMHETSLTPRPAFDNARLTSVAASNTKGSTMGDSLKDNKPDDAPAIDMTALAAALVGNAEFAKLLKPEAPKAEAKGEPVATEVNSAAHPTPGEKFAKTAMTSAVPKSVYSRDRGGSFVKGEHDFSTDLCEMMKLGDKEGKHSEFGKRVMAHIAQNFVATGDVNELNPAINQPDRYYQAPDSPTPLWDMVSKGAPPNGVTPFTRPKFASDSNLVADHAEGVEPDTGTFVTTSQTITPTALSGKVSLTREVWDQGGNPSVSNLIWARMIRSWRRGLETATATFLATLTAATDITLPGGAGTDAAIADALKAMVVSLNFLPDYSWDAFAVEKNLYTRAANLKATDGRPYFPVIGPTNADGTASSLWQRLNVGGLIATPAAGLTATPAALNSSWLFDREVIEGYATPPQRFDFAGTDAAGEYAPVAMIDLAIWGYKAFANIDIAGVRQVTFDSDLA
jgi:HK97 family phage prohead protease